MYFNDSDLLCLQSIDVRLLVRLVGKLTLYVLVYNVSFKVWKVYSKFLIADLTHSRADRDPLPEVVLLQSLELL